MKVLIIGATGATGKDLVDTLLSDENFEIVEIFVRKPTGIQHDKLNEHIVNFNKPADWKNLVTGNVAFSCMGTTLKDAGNKENQRKVDYDYQYNFAEAAKQNGVPHFILVSAYGANEKSPVFYTKMKGELEEAIKKLNFDALTIFQPGILDRKDSKRTTEKLSVQAIKVVSLFRF